MAMARGNLKSEDTIMGHVLISRKLECTESQI